MKTAPPAIVDMSFEAEVQVTRNRVVVYNLVRSFSVQTGGIHLRASVSATVSFDVYDLRGQHVRALVRGDLGSGTHSVTWRGLDDTGRPVASGTYFFRLRGADFDVSKAGVLVK